MATRSVTRVETQLAPFITVFEWAGLLTGDDGAYVLLAHYADKSVHAFGNFSGAATVAVQGSNEDTPANPGSLSDPSGTVIALTAAAPMEQVLENPLYIRPKVNAGDGSTSLTVRLVCRV